MGGSRYWSRTNILGVKVPCLAVKRTDYVIFGIILLYLSFRMAKHLRDAQDIGEWFGTLAIVVTLLLPGITCFVFLFTQ